MSSESKNQPGINETFYSAGNYKAEDSVGYLVRRVMTSLSQEIDRQLVDSDLTNAQWLPLLKLYMRKTSTVAELARGCDLDAGAMTRLLDRMETKDLCRRVRSESDRRVVNVELTESGTETAKGIPEILCQIQNAHLSGFTREEFEMLKSYLRRILVNAQTLADQATNEK